MKWPHFLQFIPTLFQAEKTNSAPLIIVDAERTLFSTVRGTNEPLYKILDEFHAQGAELCIASDGNEFAISHALGLAKDAGVDRQIFSHTLRPGTNQNLAKKSPGFWPRIFKDFKRDARQVLIIDDSEAVLSVAKEYGVNTFHIKDVPSTDETLTQLRSVFAAMLPI